MVMVWIYAVILAFSAGLLTYVLGRVADRLTSFLGLAPLSHSILSYAAISALAFMMVAQAPAMMLTSALILWYAGMRHAKQPLSFPVQAGLIVLAVMLGLAALPSPNFGLPIQIPKAALMLAVFAVWLATMLLPTGAPTHGYFAAFGLSLTLFIVGAIALDLPTGIASDAIVMGGALLGAFFGLKASNAEQGLDGQWVFLYLTGFLAASAAYSGAWWLGLLGIAPVCVYALIRKV
jgi:hypothetical protein